MAQLVEESNDGTKKFPKEPCDKNLLLGSLKTFQEQGVVLGVEKVLTPKRRDYGSGPKANINVIFTILGSMEKCRLYELDDDGQYIPYVDDMTGEERLKVYIGDGQLKTAYFPFYANIKDGEDGLDENTALVVTPGTSSYSFFKEALIDAGELPSNMGRQSFVTNFGELKEALEGWEFLGKYEKIKGKNSAFDSLLCERIEDE